MIINPVVLGWVESSDTHRYHAHMTNYRRSRIAGASYFFSRSLPHGERRSNSQQNEADRGI